MEILTIPRHGGDELRLSLSSFRGRDFLDLRTYYLADDGKMRPTPKGCTIPLWAIPSLQDALNIATRQTAGPTPSSVASLAAHRARIAAEAAREVIDPEDGGAA
jgi:hypothetical protein